MGPQITLIITDWVFAVEGSALERPCSRQGAPRWAHGRRVGFPAMGRRLADG